MLVPARRSMGMLMVLHPLEDADMGQPQRASAFKRDADHGATGGRGRCSGAVVGADSAGGPGRAAAGRLLALRAMRSRIGKDGCSRLSRT